LIIKWVEIHAKIYSSPLPANKKENQMINLIIFLIFNIYSTTNSLSVKVDNIQSDDGYLYVSLYSNDQGFPIDISKADKTLKVKAKKGFVVVQFKEIETGNYAISVYHDVNSSGKLETSFVGIPKEPIGVSNNAKGFMGPPSFKDCNFSISSTNTIKINLGDL